MSHSDDWELPGKAVLTPVRNDEVAQRTFWGTLLAGAFGIAVVISIVPRTERTPEHRAAQTQLAHVEPGQDLVAWHGDADEASEPAPSQSIAGASVASDVATERVPVTPVDSPPQTQPELAQPEIVQSAHVQSETVQPEIAQSIPRQPEFTPEPVLLPEESAPAALVAESAPVRVSEIFSPAPDALDEPPTSREALDLNDVKPRSIDTSRPGSAATLNAIVQFRARRYTLTCPHCRAQQTEAADCIADHSSFRCLSCDAKIKVRELHERLENEQKHARKLARR